MKPAPGGRPVTCCRLHSIEREKARQEEGLQVEENLVSNQHHLGLLQAQSKEIRLRLDEERKERIEKRFNLAIKLNLDGSVTVAKYSNPMEFDLTPKVGCSPADACTKYQPAGGWIAR